MIFRIKDKLEPIYYAAKRFVSHKERIKYDSWDLDHSLAVWILPRLQSLRCHKMSYSPAISQDAELLKEAIAEGFKPTGIPDKDEPALFGYALDRMVFSFMYVLSDEYYIQKDPETSKKFKRGLEIFSKYFTSLWD